MSAILGTSVTGSGAVASYTVDNSLRLRSGASAYLNRTPSVAGNRQKFTWSGWVKRGQLSSGSFPSLFYATNGSTTDDFRFNNSDVLCFLQNDGVSSYVVTNAVFRDPSAWYHIVLSVDTTQATAANRIIIYVNGVSQSLNSPTYPTQNYSGFIDNNVAHQIGRTPNGYFDGYLAEVNFIDGQALTPSSFGATNASTGVWQPKAYAGSYGTNGFYLKFSDIATTSGSNAGLGKDFSGNSNYWNTNNISVTSGYTYDAMTDSPTPKSTTVGNFCVVNTLANFNSGTNSIYNANLSHSGSTNQRFLGTIGVTSGKWYYEHVVESTTGAPTIGIANESWGGAAGPGTNTGSWGVWLQTGNSGGNGVAGPSCGAFAVGDILQVAYDMDAGYVWFGKNNTWAGSGNPSAGTNPAFTGLTGTMFMAFQQYAAGSFNFGQRAFNYTPPTNFKRLNTYNLSTPTIGASSTTLANKYFDATLYTGTGANQTITNSGSTQPDLVWVKVRSTTGTHVLTDSVRGANKQLFSNLTNAEASATNKITGFTSTGFTLGADDGTGTGDANFNGSTYVGWQWRASNATGVTNTAGSITSTVSANTTSGFSIVTYTGTGANATVGHGLGVAPKMIIVKNRSSALDWRVYVEALGNGNALSLNTTGASGATSNWNNTSPTSTVFSLGTAGGVNGSGNSLVAYCFAEVAGFSKFGSYTGNSSTDGTFVYTGFRPAYVMIKRSSAAGQWSVRDDMRLGYNANNYALEANQNTAETSSTVYACDLLSNGFKLRTADDAVNQSGDTYIYMAFAKNPFNYSLAR